MITTEIKPVKPIWDKDARTYLMGIAIIFVVGVHLSGWIKVFPPGSKLPAIIDLLFSKGDAGVNIFFVLSAYGLCFSYEKNSHKSFYCNRIKRLFPTYAISQIYALAVGGGENFVRSFADDRHTLYPWLHTNLMVP